MGLGSESQAKYEPPLCMFVLHCLFYCFKLHVFKSEFLNCLEKLDYLVVLDVHGSNMQGFDRTGAS